MIKLRRAKKEDCQRISDICRANQAIYEELMPDAFIRQADKLKLGLPENYKIKVIEKNDQIVGFIGYKSLNEQVMYLVAIYLDADRYKQGIGSKALKLFENACIQNELLLLVHEKATWAKAFYEKQGFDYVEEPIDQYRTGMMKKLYIQHTQLMRKMKNPNKNNFFMI